MFYVDATNKLMSDDNSDNKLLQIIESQSTSFGTSYVFFD